MSAGVSTMDMSRPGECVDLFYYDGETSKKQCYASTVNTKYTQAFQNTGAGTSVFTLSPNSGVQDVVCSFVTPALASNTNLAIPRGWAYALIKQVSFRYGGSSQFFLSGDQILQNAMRCQPNRSAVDDLLTLGGNFAAGATLADKQYGSVVLKLPHSWPSGVGKSHPFPSDCITQAIQITVELFPLNQIFSTSTAGGSATPPTQLDSGTFQVQQCVLNNAGDSLARRVDLSLNAYAFPCEFVQNIQRIPLPGNTTSVQPITLTGFRAGECTKIICWLTRSSEQPVQTAGSVYNPFNFYLPQSVQLSYAGDVYARYENATSPLWNLINGNKAPVFDNILITGGGAGTPVGTTPVLNEWVELPFAQTLVDEDSHYTLVHGKIITNGLCNLDIATPTAQTDWVLNVSYIYNATLLVSQGTCDYIF